MFNTTKLPFSTLTSLFSGYLYALINSHTVMLLNLLSGLLAAVTPTVTG